MRKFFPDKRGFQMFLVQNLKLKSTPYQAGKIFNEEEIWNLFNGLDQNKITITTNVIQI